jgi:transcriptional regulator with XRE-family HTH domain
MNMDLWRKIFRARFAELKQSDGLTQDKLAEMLDVTQGTVGHWHNGHRSPRDLKQFRRLETALKLAPGTLTQPETEGANGGDIYQVSSQDKPNETLVIKIEVIERTTLFLVNHIGHIAMERNGARWVAETIMFLYDLFSDPEAEKLSKDTIIKLIGNIKRDGATNQMKSK